MPSVRILRARADRADDVARPVRRLELVARPPRDLARPPCCSRRRGRPCPLRPARSCSRRTCWSRPRRSRRRGTPRGSPGSRPGRLKFSTSEMFSWPSQSRCRSSVRGLEVGPHRPVEDDDAPAGEFEEGRALLTRRGSVRFETPSVHPDTLLNAGRLPSRLAYARITPRYGCEAASSAENSRPILQAQAVLRAGVRASSRLSMALIISARFSFTNRVGPHVKRRIKNGTALGS